ncbi:uncharacterized protein LOC130657895 [Hydractinia symbiolongicarpus]|uniref:uncharacterized protein LOC130657895 n=1 Tax=Hydractinia symbiolongicarpus TaxID=13093 RepID=UPI002550E85B|nr:uncharacterized protein LOC130657895 [Hydractinia symbiolongicarpus]
MPCNIAFPIMSYWQLLWLFFVEGVEWRNKQVIIFTDNQAVVQIWCSGSCKCPHIMNLVRKLFFFLAQHNINLLLRHIEGATIQDVSRRTSRTLSTTSISVGSLEDELRCYFTAAPAPNTRRTYLSGHRSYVRFCKSLHIAPYPAVERTLQLYVTFQARHVTYNTIKVYLSAIQYQSVVLGFSTQIYTMRRLYYVVGGIRRSHPHQRLRRLPITPVHLRDMLRFVGQSGFKPIDKLMWRALILLAFFGHLRVSEYVSPSVKTFDASVNLMATDIFIDSDSNIATVNIKCFKTDPFRMGFKIRLARIGGELCPVAALENYLLLRDTTPGPLFVLHCGDFVTKKYVSSFLKISLSLHVDLNTHSFRIGGASAAASCGIPDSAIKIIGRWSSDCYRRYIHLSIGL